MNIPWHKKHKFKAPPRPKQLGMLAHWGLQPLTGPIRGMVEGKVRVRLRHNHVGSCFVRNERGIWHYAIMYPDYDPETKAMGEPHGMLQSMNLNLNQKRERALPPTPTAWTRFDPVLV